MYALANQLQQVQRDIMDIHLVDAYDPFPIHRAFPLLDARRLPAPAHMPNAAPAHMPNAAPAHMPNAAPAHMPNAAPAHMPNAAPAHILTAAPAHMPNRAAGDRFPAMIPLVYPNNQLPVPNQPHADLPNPYGPPFPANLGMPVAVQQAQALFGERANPVQRRLELPDGIAPRRDVFISQRTLHQAVDPNRRPHANNNNNDLLNAVLPRPVGFEPFYAHNELRERHRVGDEIDPEAPRREEREQPAPGVVVPPPPCAERSKDFLPEFAGVEYRRRRRNAWRESESPVRPVPVIFQEKKNNSVASVAQPEYPARIQNEVDRLDQFTVREEAADVDPLNRILNEALNQPAARPVSFLSYCFICINISFVS